MYRLANAAVTRRADLLVTAAPACDPRAIGEILVTDSKLAPDRAERPMRRRITEGLSFSEPAIELSAASEPDVAPALAQQLAFSYLPQGVAILSEKLSPVYRPHSPDADALRVLCGQFKQPWLNRASKPRGLPTVGAGRGRARR